MSEATTYLELRDLRVSYGKVEALHGISVHVEQGEIVTIPGANGAGKTTLIRLVCGLQAPTAGDYTLYGVPHTAPEIHKARRRMGAVVETPSVYLDLTAADNLKLQYRLLGLPSEEGIPELLHLVGLGDTGKKKARHFSLGMRQRLAIAQAIMEDPAILLLDEPLNGLDYEGVKTVYDILKVQKERGKIILVASHHEEDIRLLCDEVYWLKDGILERIEDISEYTRFKEEWVKNEKTD